jgi:hypothetical protein
MADPSLASLAAPAQLRAFVDAMADLTETPACAVLRAMVAVLERQARRTDDMDHAHRIGRLLHAVRAELGRDPRPGHGACPDPCPGRQAGGAAAS